MHGPQVWSGMVIMFGHHVAQAASHGIMLFGMPHMHALVAARAARAGTLDAELLVTDHCPACRRDEDQRDPRETSARVRHNAPERKSPALFAETIGTRRTASSAGDCFFERFDGASAKS